MKTAFREVIVQTKSRMELVDITSDVEKIVTESSVKQGMCIVYLPHSTATIIVNEHEDGLMQDILKMAEKLFPVNAGWLHDRIDDNAHAHLASTMFGPSKVFAVKDGKIVRGRWQNIFLLELDGPRSRRVIIQTLGE